MNALSKGQRKKRASLPPEVLNGKSIVLVGMMGAGKTSVGRRLAQRLDVPFVDADKKIEEAAGQTITEIFADHGEAYFRDGERRVLKRLLDQGGPQVLSTGGGAFMDEENRKVIEETGISVWLKADFATLMRRVRRRPTRPLLQTPDPEATMRKLLAERDPVYALADVTVKTEDVAHGVIVNRILTALGNRLGQQEQGATK